MMINSELDLLKAQTNKVFNEALKLNEMFNNEYFNLLYFKFKDKGDVTFSDLQKIKKGETTKIYTLNDESIITCLVDKADNLLTYVTTFSSDAIFLRHFHSDCYEKIIVTSDDTFKVVVGERSKGNLKEFFIKQGESFLLNKGVNHQVINKGGDNATLKVEFFK